MNARPDSNTPVLYLVVCAAPPARQIGDLVHLLMANGWKVCIIASPTAATWIDTDDLARQTGYPVRSEYKQPGDPDVLPKADAIAVVPATFNTINKWAAGISDNLALGILNEALGLDLPIVAIPYAKPTLTQHPAYSGNIQLLAKAGVKIADTATLQPVADDGRGFRWGPVRDEIQRLLDRDSHPRP